MKSYNEFINESLSKNKLVIHLKDKSTDFLKSIYHNKNFEVINFNKNNFYYR